MAANNSSVERKKSYTAPRLTVHGSVEKITLEINKTFGVGDGLTFQGQSIMNIS